MREIRSWRSLLRCGLLDQLMSWTAQQRPDGRRCRRRRRWDCSPRCNPRTARRQAGHVRYAPVRAAPSVMGPASENLHMTGNAWPLHPRASGRGEVTASPSRYASRPGFCAARQLHRTSIFGRCQHGHEVPRGFADVMRSAAARTAGHDRNDASPKWGLLGIASRCTSAGAHW